MYNHFDHAVDQVESGIYSVKRVIAMARKIVAMEEEHYKSLHKALQHEYSKNEKIGADNMLGFMDIYSKSKGLFERMALEHKVISDNVNKRVLMPLMDFYHAAENRLKAIVAEERRVTQEVAQAKSVVTKFEKECKKLHTQLSALQMDSSKADHGKEKDKSGFFSKMKAKISQAAAGDSKKLTDQLVQSAKGYQDAVQRGNARLQQYIDKDLPSVFDDLQTLEHDRLTMLNDKLETLHHIYHRSQESTTVITTEMTLCTKSFSVDTDISRFLNNFIFAYGTPMPFTQFTYQLPCSPDEILSGRLDAHPDSMFKASLATCMRLQEDAHPNLDVPYILRVLISAICARGGLNTEGIFRISHQKDELEKMRQQFENGDYTITSSSPHAPAALLKEWLRDLSEALIPNEQYSEAIAITRAAGSDTPTAAAVLTLFDKLDQINRNVIRDIALLCAEISSVENQKINRMSLENLAIVFAPSFLRNPSENPMEILNNTKYEVRFVTSLLAAVATRFSEMGDSITALQPAAKTSIDFTSTPSSGTRSGAPSPFFTPAKPPQLPSMVPPSPSTAPTPLVSPAPLVNAYNASIIVQSNRGSTAQATSLDSCSSSPSNSMATPSEATTPVAHVPPPPPPNAGAVPPPPSTSTAPMSPPPPPPAATANRAGASSSFSATAPSASPSLLAAVPGSSPGRPSLYQPPPRLPPPVPGHNNGNSHQ